MRISCIYVRISGSYAGAVLGMPLSGIFTEYVGWESCFYFYGVFGVTWYVFWHMIAYERPSTHTRIKPDEREYIEKSISQNTSITISNKVSETTVSSQKRDTPLTPQLRSPVLTKDEENYLAKKE